jgi:exosome complex exonuclease RRP6
MSASISSDFSTFTANLQKALVASSRTASSIPSSRDVKYQRTLNRQLGKKLDAQADRTLRLTARLLSHSAQLLEGSTSKKGKSKAVEEEEDLTDGYQRNVVGITDGLLEKIDADLDLLRRGVTGKKAAASSFTASTSAAAEEEAVVPPAVASSSSFPSTSRLPREILNATNLPKPQLLFLDKPNTSRDAVFLPLIKEKIHGITPQVSHEPEVFYDYFYTNAEGTAGGERTRIPNPYAQEIDKAIIDNPLPEFELQGGAAEADEVEGQVMQDGMDKKPFSYVDTLQGMKECLDKLKKEKVIAVDLEHHDYRSFRGFTSLIQVNSQTYPFTLQ